MFINTNWGFASKLFVLEKTQKFRVDKIETKLKPGRNFIELNNLKIIWIKNGRKQLKTVECFCVKAFVFGHLPKHQAKQRKKLESKMTFTSNEQNNYLTLNEIPKRGRTNVLPLPLIESSSVHRTHDLLHFTSILRDGRSFHDVVM